MTDNLAFIPARGGSKSIPLKNLAKIGGITLLEYAINAARSCPKISSIICSTDHQMIAEEAHRLGVEVDHRPADLGTDEANVLDVVKEFINRSPLNPEIVVLFQPTNPFVRTADIERTLSALESSRDAKTAQTVAKVPHNYHAWNQREIQSSFVTFALKDKRLGAFNKQKKPELYKFGNLVAVRRQALFTMHEFFDEPSIGVKIDFPYDLDVDGPKDVEMGETLLSSGLVYLPHLD